MSIPEYARTNFNTLLRAAATGDLALVECADAMTGAPRYVTCHRAGWRRLHNHALRSPRAGQPL
jgi:uncharacterized protein DUF6117